MSGVDKRAKGRAAQAAGQKIELIARRILVSRRSVRAAFPDPTPEVHDSPRQTQPMPERTVKAAPLHHVLDEDAARLRPSRESWRDVINFRPMVRSPTTRCGPISETQSIPGLAG